MAQDLHLAVVADAAGKPVHRADELGHELRRGLAVDVLGRVDLFEAAGTHHADAVGDRERFGLVVSDKQGGDPQSLLKAANLSSQLQTDASIQRRQRLIEQQHLWLDRECARDSHALLLPAGELVRIAVCRLGEPDELEELVGALQPLRLVLSRMRSPKATFVRTSMFGNRL